MSGVQERVATLETHPVLRDDVPNIEAPLVSLYLDDADDFGYADRDGFETNWRSDLDRVVELQPTLQRGKHFISLVYTYRSCSKALPQISAQEEPNKAEIHEKYFDVLEPEIKKLKEFFVFHQEAISLFCDHIRSIGEGLNLKTPQTYSEVYIYQLVKMLDLFSILDALKNMKACLNNDFSFFKRSFSFLRKTSSNDDQTIENQKLNLFLAQPNSISTELKKAVQLIPYFDDALALIVNQCAHYMERKLYLTPQEMHRLIRVIPFGLLLMDGEKNDEKNNVFKSKKIRIARFPPLFNKYPIVPLFGDMQITLENSIKRSAHFDEKAWGSMMSLADVKLQQEYELVYQIDAIRAQHNSYVAKFSNMITRIRKLRKGKADVTKWNATTVKAFVAIILEGLQLLGDWSGRVQRQSAWKYAHPINDKDIVEYEAVVKRNYSEREVRVLLELIALVKGLARLMLKHETTLMPVVRLSVHTELQEMIHVHLREATMTASKKKRPIREEMVHLRDLAADWPEGASPDADPAIFGKKAPKSSGKAGAAGDGSASDTPTRSVGPSHTQLEYVRTLVYGFLAWKITGRKGAYSDKDLESKSFKALDDFYQASYFWRHLLDYANTILKCTDFSDLWYREFYLEMCKSDKFPQFPIEMSLPWILTDHVLDSNDAVLTEYMFYPLDIYNDSARRALSVLKQRFLFDEVEAELNLCLDQLVFKLSEQVFEHAKAAASYSLMERAYRSDLEIAYPDTRFVPPRSRLGTFAKQRHFTLLGRTFDLNLLVAQRLNAKMRQNVEYAIQRMCASELCNVVELEFHLRAIRATHTLLRREYQLDPWDMIFREINEGVGANSFIGRVLKHLLLELENDFFPNFNYVAATNRFLRSPVPPAEEVLREVMPKDNVVLLFGSKGLNIALDNMFVLYQNFLGLPHFVALVRVLGMENVPLLVSEVINSWGNKLRNVIDPYFRELLVGMPPNSRLPLYDYKTEGNYGFFANNLRDILAYPELNPQVFQQFKEVGNVVAWLALLENAIAVVNAQSFSLNAPFLGVTLDPNTTSKDGGGGKDDPELSSDNLGKEASSSTTTSSALNVKKTPLVRVLHGLAKAGGKHADKVVAADVLKPMDAFAATVADACQPRPFAFLRGALAMLDRKMDLVRAGWCGNPPENGVMSVDATAEFYRLYSALQFLFLEPPPAGSPGETNLAMFGDGFAWGGITLLYLLDQIERFQCFDFMLHILNVADVHPPDPANKALQAFLRHAHVMQDTITSVLGLLNKNYPRYKSAFTIFSPPATESAATEFISSAAAAANLHLNVSMQSLDNSSGSMPTSARGSARPAPSARASQPPPPPAEPDDDDDDNDDGDLPPPPLPRDEDDDDEDDGDLPPPPLPRDDDDDDDDDGAPPPLPRDDDDDDDDGAPPPLPRD